MANVNGKAFALTILSPIKPGYTVDSIAFADAVRDRLQGWNEEENSPMSLVPQTYLCRYFVLDDVYTESLPGGSVLDALNDFLPIVPDAVRRAAMPAQDHLQSRYLVFSANIHCGASGAPDDYLRGMWQAISERIKEVWGFCYGFEAVKDAESFLTYMKKCQLKASLFFVGSTDDPLPEQLKSLYLKQEFTQFAIDNQGLDAAQLRANYKAFIARVAPTHVASPSWEPGKYRI